MARNLMILPTLACPASCSYCFGPHQGQSTMGVETIEAAAQWQEAILPDGEPLEITFHGGEPLAAGTGFYRMALPLLLQTLDSRDVRFSIQSNLWLLSETFCELFAAYHVSLGTSLDGPEQINDAQRGAGYFRRTLAGIQRARSYGLGSGCICTFTAQSAAELESVFGFFLEQHLDFSIHAALPTLGQPADGWTLPAEAYGELLCDLLERYLPHADRIRVSTLDAMARSISTRRGSMCTFGDCLGHYLAIDPEGYIFPCQRFAGHTAFQLGNVQNMPTLDALQSAPAWQMLQRRQEEIEAECGGCPYLEICRGGCPYNVLAANSGRFNGSLRDPYCTAYRKIFSRITDRALDEVFSQENMEAAARQGSKAGWMRKGQLVRIMRGDEHPKEVGRRAREIAAAAALGASRSGQEAVEKLERAGLVKDREAGLASLNALQRRLDAQPQEGLLNAYLHVTYRCNLACSHCYARSGPQESASMSVEQITRMMQQIKSAGFRKAVITGGEPLMHPQRDAVLDRLDELRREIKPLKTVLRTNLAVPVTPALLENLATCSDQVVVSVDGDRESHDARRGTGSYQRTVVNLRSLLALKPEAVVSLAAVLTPQQSHGEAGESVRALAEALGVRLRIKTLLPLGRAAGQNLRPAQYSSLEMDGDTRVMGARPVSTCGLGMNMYIAPDGRCYPCYTLMGAEDCLGNAFKEGMSAVLQRNDAYRQVTVDSNQRCQSCDLRYLCGGFCRAWGLTADPDDPPQDCASLYAGAARQLQAALEVLCVPAETWQAAGLPAVSSIFDLA